MNSQNYLFIAQTNIQIQKGQKMCVYYVTNL